MYDTVLIPTDGSEGAVGAARHGIAVAAACDATVHVLNVVDTRAFSEALADVDELARRGREALERRGRDAVGEIEALAGRSGVEVVSSVEEGRPYEIVREYAERHGIDLIAMGTHGRTGIERFLLGSVAERIVRSSPVPVLTARDGAEEELPAYGDVLVATDGSETALAAADHGVDLARRFDATVHVVHVVTVPSPSIDDGDLIYEEVFDALEEDGRAFVGEVAARAEEAGVEAVTAVPRGTPARRLGRYVEEHGIDLVVMGTHGRTGVERYLLGSVAERLIRTSSAPVLTVRAERGG